MNILWFPAVSRQILVAYRAFSGGYLTPQPGRRMYCMIICIPYITEAKEMIATLFYMKR